MQQKQQTLRLRRTLLRKFSLTQKDFFVHNNKCVDFVLAIEDRLRVTTIYTFDLTVSTNVSSKITDAQKFLKNLVARSPNMFKFVHVIVTPKEACQERIIISNNLSI